MDSKNGNPEKQDQLDLEFSHIEPITPKKPLENKRSLSDKVFGFVGSLGKKETAGTVNNTVHTVSENVIGQSAEPVRQNVVQLNNGESAHSNPEYNTAAENTMNNEHNENQSIPAETNTQSETMQQNESMQAEPPVEKAAATVSGNWKKPETWVILQRLPEKHRRIAVALLAMVLLLVFFLWLRPDSTTVESYQPESTNSLPIEFQPLDQSAIAESSQTADNSAAGESAETVEINGVAAETIPQRQSNSNAAQQLAESMPNAVPSPSQPEPAAQPSPQPVQPAAQSQQVQPRPSQPSVSESAVEKPKISENKAEAKTAVKPAEKAKPAIVDAKPAQHSSGRAAIVEAQSTRPAQASGNGKTLTIEKGKTLFQVFRDNGLDIRDANAMTKAKGAGNALSSFKPGDKIQVSASGGRVTEMRLPNGTRFVRQSDGSYSYK